MSSHLDRARMLIDVHRYRDAAAAILDHLAERPDNSDGRAMLARCYLALNQTQDALREVEVAIHLRPDHSYAHYIHSFVLQELKRPKEARRAIQEALRISPEDADYFAHSANLYNVRGQHKAAGREAGFGLEIDPQHVECTCERAFALMCLEKYSRANKILQEVLAAQPDHARIHANLGWISLNSERYAIARRHFLEALRIDPDYAWAAEGLEKSRLSHPSLQWIAGWESQMCSSWLGYLGTIFLLMVFIILGCTPPGIYSPSLSSGEAAAQRVFNTVVFSGMSLIGIFILAGEVIANAGALVWSRDWIAVKANQLQLAIASVVPFCTGIVLLVLGSASQSPAVHAMGNVLFWGSPFIANFRKYDSVFARRAIWFGTTVFVSLGAVHVLLLSQASQYWLLFAWIFWLATLTLQSAVWRLNYIQLSSR